MIDRSPPEPRRSAAASYGPRPEYLVAIERMREQERRTHAHHVDALRFEERQLMALKHIVDQLCEIRWLLEGMRLDQLERDR